MSDMQNFATLSSTGFWGAQGAGVVVFAKSTKRYLMVLRSGAVEQPNTWSLTIGGAIDGNEDPKRAAIREFHEETHYRGAILSVNQLSVYSTKTNSGSTFRYHNFLLVIPEEFQPSLNWETSKFKWSTYQELLSMSPKHFGTKYLISQSGGKLKSLVESRASFVLFSGEQNSVWCRDCGEELLCDGEVRDGVCLPCFDRKNESRVSRILREDIRHDAEVLAANLLKKYGLHDWKFSWMRSAFAYAMCDDQHKTVKLSTDAVRKGWDFIKQSLLHEIAHALTPGDRHGPRWRKMAQKLGYRDFDQDILPECFLP